MLNRESRNVAEFMIVKNHTRLLVVSRLSSMLFVASLMMAAMTANAVPLFGIFETQVTNSNSYSNPYNFQEIELQATFTAPSGASYDFFGFHDGNGSGGDSGDVWKLRFAPNETGTWNYSYTWTDGTAGSSGSFAVQDTGLPGPLRVADDNPWFFDNGRGEPVDIRGYSVHQYLEGKYGRGVYSSAAVSDLIDKIHTRVADRNYNLLMVAWPVFIESNGNHFWQGNPDFNRFDVSMWKRTEDILQAAADRSVYVTHFLALVDQFSERPSGAEMTRYLRYMAARIGPYWNHFGYSVTWEYHDIYSDSNVTDIMSQLQSYLNNLPLSPMLSVHDHSDNSFSGWLDFSMRQKQSTNVFDGNCRDCGKQGGVGSNFVNRPILGSEDIWEYQNGRFDQPRNGEEVRRGAWGIQMAGVMPLYSEVGLADDIAPAGGRSNFSGQGESEVRRMFDFYYANTRYRQYQSLNGLVSSSSGQIASGIPGVEYLVYDEGGGSITIDLSGTPASNSFSVLWYDPKSGGQQSGGSVQGGASRTLTSPYSGDSVLLMGGGSGAGGGDTVAPMRPEDMDVN